ncbi:MAG TPA: thiamine phosphate synthase [Pyrinomonadaceae bacterium]|nr:thiamine phosphate synthase [Pyrinomonadaceae bacterium]
MFPPVKVYPITDIRLTGLSHSEQVSLLIQGGATLIQLREKHLSPHEFFQQAQAAIEVARPHGVRIIINDRVDIALALKADGVHLGQDDMPPGAARAILGEEALIGFSTHSPLQAIAAHRLPIDYVALGPIFRTSSKNDPDPVVGLASLQQVRKAIGDFPLVAIGGITSENLASVLEAGATCAAVIRAALADSSRIASTTKRLISLTR